MSDYTTRPQYLALLAAVRADPADDLPRLVLADWLEERGEVERAEFIRVQCEIAMLKAAGQTASSRYYGLKRVERELWDGGLYAVYRKEVPGGIYVLLEGWTSGNISEVHPVRGFVGHVRAPLAVLVGGECERCGDPDGHSPGWCLGRRGILPRLVREHPVEVVRVVGSGPQEASDREWCWARLDDTTPPNDIIDPASELPPEVFDALAGGEMTGTHERTYPTRETAIDALSDALLAWAKAQTTDCAGAVSEEHTRG